MTNITVPNKLSDLPVLKLCTKGLSERTTRTMAVFIERQLAGVCELVPGDLADAVLIDLDAQGAKQLMAEQLEIAPNQPMLLLSLSTLDQLPPNAILLQKPIKVDVFFKILCDLRSQVFKPRQECHFSAANEQVLQSRLGRAGDTGSATKTLVEATDHAAKHLNSRESHFYIGSMPDVDLGQTGERAKVFYDPREFLLGFVQKAVAQGLEAASVVRLSSFAFGDIEIYPFARKVVSHTPASALYAAGRLPLREGDVRIAFDRAAPQFPTSERQESLDEFLWKLALWASRGRLPVGTDPDLPVVLKRWPNLTRLLVSPHATRIAGLWAREPLVLSNSATVLCIPQRYVFAFYSACVALELVTPAKRALDPLLVVETVRPHEKRGIFRMLLSKLVGNREE